MHPNLLESQLRLQLAWRRWWQRQPDNALLLLASLVLAALGSWLLAGLAERAIGWLQAAWARLPWVVATVALALSALAGWRSSARARQYLASSRWAVQPRSAAERDALLATLSRCSALAVGLIAFGSAWLLQPMPLTALAAGAGCGLVTLSAWRLAGARGTPQRRAGARQRAASQWPGDAFEGLLRRWLSERIGVHWRHGGTSLGGFLLLGLVVPGEARGVGLLVGLLIAGLLLRWLVSLQASGRLLLEAGQRLAAQPLQPERWRRAHRRCICAASAWLGGIAALGAALLGASPWLLPLLPATLLALASLDLWILAACRKQPRRRTLSWRVLAVIFVLVARDLGPLLPLIWLLTLLHFRRLALRQEQPEVPDAAAD